jgi:RalA-binding protein 1
MLTPTFLPFTQIKVTNSHIRANEKSKEVISFSININIIIPPESDPERKGAKASWVVEKFYSDVLTLDHLVKSKHSKSQNKALAQLPDRALFKDHAPSKVDARKVSHHHHHHYSTLVSSSQLIPSSHPGCSSKIPTELVYCSTKRKGRRLRFLQFEYRD